MTFGNARTKAELEQQLRDADVLSRYPDVGSRNAYYCADCRKCIVTVDMDRGTTPMFMACKATTGCTGRMTSSGYPPEPMPKDLESCAVWEWYRPITNALGLFHEDQLVDEHVRRGGLLLRRRE